MKRLLLAVVACIAVACAVSGATPSAAQQRSVVVVGDSITVRVPEYDVDEHCDNDTVAQ